MIFISCPFLLICLTFCSPWMLVCLKMNFSKACHAYISNHPGQMITTAVIASLVADPWPHSLIPFDILSGFKKCGIHPLNLGEVNDRQLAPSEALHGEKSQPDKEPDNLFTWEQESLYRRDDLKKDTMSMIQAILAWVRINHPDTSPPCSVSAVSTVFPYRFTIIRNFKQIAGFTKT